MARCTKEEADNTRKLLIDAAITVFDRKCYSKTSLQDIAEEAGKTRGAVYWHFKNKAEIFQEINKLIAAPMDTMLDEIEQSTERIMERLQEEITGLLVRSCADGRMRSIFNVIFERTEYSEEVQDSIDFKNKKRRDFVRRLERLFQQSQEQGELRADLNPKELAIALWAIFSGIFIFWASDQEAFSIQDSASNLLDLFFKGLKA